LDQYFDQKGHAMATVTAYEAKTHLARLLRAVERGERIVITRHGKAVAELVPIGTGARNDFEQLKARRLALRARLPSIPLEELLAARHEGHKY
jgi:prevent-host-death family protein